MPACLPSDENEGVSDSINYSALPTLKKSSVAAVSVSVSDNQTSKEKDCLPATNCHRWQVYH